MAIYADDHTEIANHVTDSAVLLSIAQRVRQQYSIEIEVLAQVRALVKRWTAKATTFRQSGHEPMALEADKRVVEYEELAADLAAALPLLDVLPDVDILAAEHRRRER